MKILFYVNPFFVRNNPTFYSGAIKNKLLLQANIFSQLGYDISFITNEVDALAIPSEFKSFSITQKEILAIFGTTENKEIELYKNSEQHANLLSELIRNKIKIDFDFIFAWETPANFLSIKFRNSVIIHQMPGFLSRTPFPELLISDINGLFNESSLTNKTKNIDAEYDERGMELIDQLRHDVLPSIFGSSPYTKADLDPRGEFDQLILLPLQISEQYAFLADSKYTSQISLLIDVLSETPSNVGVVVTQYVNKTASEKVLDSEKYLQLKNIYPNLIWDESFDKLDNISQYLIGCVDAVATVSSSIGLQALLWKKPLIALSNTYISNAATYGSINDFICNKKNNSLSSSDKILSWMLTYQQPLASLMLHNPEFLNSWLLKIKEEKRLPNFFELGFNYTSEFSKSIKLDKAEKQLANVFGYNNIQHLETSFKKKLSEKTPDLISFDIFDTLIDRAVEQPTHVFKFIEKEIEKVTNNKISNFSTVRASIERLTRDIAKKENRQEITLDEIFYEISLKYGLSEQEAQQAKNTEINAELNFIKKRESGWKLFNMARNSGANIILISDMYLPEVVIRALLSKSGYPENIKLYLSSSIGLRKHEGDLFSYVKQKENINTAKWLHIGDNPYGDIQSPEKFGISTFLIKSAFRCIEENKKLFPLIQTDRKSRTLSESAIYGVMQKRWFDDPMALIPSNTHFGGNPLMLGYVGLGPLLFGFLQWVMIQAKSDNVDKLLFLSRDGKILWEMAKILFPKKNGWPSTEYAMSSRRAARVASMKNIGDISKLIDSSISQTTIYDLFHKKFGIKLTSNDEKILSKHGFSNLKFKVGPANREQLRALSFDLSDRILNNAEQERNFLIEHYKSLGVTKGNKIGIVDIGYAATMQAAMADMMDGSTINGYYYITFETALDASHKTGTIRGYAADFAKRTIHPDPICKNGFLYETLFCCSDSTFVKFMNDGKDLKAIFDPSENDTVRRRVVDRAHAGAVLLARDLNETFSSYMHLMMINSVTASKILADLICLPSGRDAEIFEGCIFDDGFAGSESRYIVPPRNMIKSTPEIVNKSIWKEGAAVFSRRPDVSGKNASISSNTKTNKDMQSKDISLVNIKESKNEITQIKNNKNRILRIEEIIITKFLNNRKANKYKSNRINFFMDSKNIIIKFYWSLIGKKAIPISE